MKGGAILQKYNSRTGEIIRYYEMFIPKNGDPIKTEFRELPVLLVHKNSVVVLYGSSFIELSIKRDKYHDRAEIGKIKSGVRDWGKGLMNYNGLVAHGWSFQPEKTLKRQVHSALKRVVVREYGAYGIMLDKIEVFLDKITEEQARKSESDLKKLMKKL